MRSTSWAFSSKVSWMDCSSLGCMYSATLGAAALVMMVAPTKATRTATREHRVRIKPLRSPRQAKKTRAATMRMSMRIGVTMNDYLLSGRVGSVGEVEPGGLVAQEGDGAVGALEELSLAQKVGGAVVGLKVAGINAQTVGGEDGEIPPCGGEG